MKREGLLGDTRRIVRCTMSLAAVMAAAVGVTGWTPSRTSASVTDLAVANAVGKPGGMVALPESLHPLARPQFEVGRMDPDIRLTGMSLLFKLPPSKNALLKYAVAAAQDPKSPNYHEWLTPEQCATEFGASSTDITRATSWLKSRGLDVDGPSRTATRLGFSGTVEQIERGFQTEMRRYRVHGENHFAMSKAPSVPPELASMILGLHGLHDFRANRPPKRQAQYALSIPQTDGGTLDFPVLAPTDFATIYDVQRLYASGITGVGQNIAVGERSDFNDADIAAFRSTFGLSSNQPSRLLVPNTGAASVNDNLFEAELDLEWAGAVAKDATVVSVFTGDAPNVTELDPLFYAIEQRAAPVLSLSFGRCEEWHTTADAAFAEGYGEIASIEGMTVLAASGDTGAAACDTQSALAATYGKAALFPASVPSIVAVGGSALQLTPSNQSTYLDTQLNALSYIPESAWNETLEDIDAGYGGLGAGGGGASKLFSKPPWQMPYTPNDGFRDLPDMALSASADVLPYAVSMSWTAADGDAEALQPEALTAYAGTSAASPAFAGILALLNQAVAEANPGAPIGLGNVNPTLYALANNAASSDAFRDITTGDNVVPCEPASPDCPSSPPYQFGFAAGDGYDQATGLGSIDGANLVAAWKAMTPTSTSLHMTASGNTAGSTLQLSATVASTATANAMTGTLVFYFIAPGDGGAGVSGTLGAAPIVASTSSGTEGGSASLTSVVPGGLNGSGVEIAAFFAGDSHYLASWSSLSTVTAASTLVMCPSSVTLTKGQGTFTFSTSGGRPPIAWSTHADGTCGADGQHVVCSSVDGGVFTAGPNVGLVTVVAIDQDDSYVTSAVKVVDAGPDGAVPPLPVGMCGQDAGEAYRDATEPPDGADVGDAPMAVESDEASDAAMPDSSTKSGCGCSAAGVDNPSAAWGSTGLLLALSAARRALSRPHQRRSESRTSRMYWS